MRISILKKLKAILAVSVLINLTFMWYIFFGYKLAFDTYESKWLFNLDANSEWFPNGVIGDNITGYPYLIVPNIVHYVLIDKNEISFVHYLSIISAINVQNPDRIYIHCTCDSIIGYYWTLLAKLDYTENYYFKNKIVVRKISKHSTVYGIRISKSFYSHHFADIVKNRVLLEYGGIYLDTDMYLLKPLDIFRKFEFTIGYQTPQHVMSVALQIGHKRARFLRLYLQTYQKYVSNDFAWNANIYPTRVILDTYPHLVHLVTHNFGFDYNTVCDLIYKQNVDIWSYDYYSIHLYIRDNKLNDWFVNVCFSDNSLRYPLSFNETMIKTLNTTFGRMARLVFHNTSDKLMN